MCFAHTALDIRTAQAAIAPEAVLNISYVQPMTAFGPDTS